MSDKLVTVATFLFPFQAQMAKLHLEAEGIEAIIPGNVLSQSPDPAGIYGIRLMVKEEDAGRAAAILADTAQ